MCRKKLEDDPGFSKEQHHCLHSYFKQLLERGTNSFHDNKPAVKEVETFCKMLASEGPFTAVIDGLNVAGRRATTARRVRQVDRQCVLTVNLCLRACWGLPEQAKELVIYNCCDYRTGYE